MGSIETLTTDACLGLLGTSTIGRLGLMINGTRTSSRLTMSSMAHS